MGRAGIRSAENYFGDRNGALVAGARTAHYRSRGDAKTESRARGRVNFELSRKTMSATGQVPSGWDERMRLIRLRRKKERPKFWAEFMIIPGWLMGLVAVLYVIALVIAIAVNLSF